MNTLASHPPPRKPPRDQYLHSRAIWAALRRNPSRVKDAPGDTPQTAGRTLAQLIVLVEATPCPPCALARAFGADLPLLAQRCGWRA